MPASVPNRDDDHPSEPAPRATRHKLVRIATWFYGISTAFLLLSALVVAILLNSTSFHNYLLKTVREQASESLGVRVQLQNFALHLSTLSLDLYGVTVDGASPYSNPPLLQVQHAEAGVRIVSVLQRKWYLDGVRIDHPVVQVFVDKDGRSNIPTIKSSGNSSNNTTVFDLGIRHAVLDGGEVFYNDQPSALSADLHNVDFHAAFVASMKQYSGKLAYADGRLVYGTFKPFTHNLDAQFDATPTTFHLSPAKITSGATQIVLSATATNYSNPSVQAGYDVTLDGEQLAKLLNNPAIPAGLVRATGSAQYQAVPNHSMIEELVVNGDISSRQLLVKTTSVHAAVDNIAGHYSLTNGDVTLHDFRASLLGGQVTAQGTMKSVAGNNPRSDATASVRGISLSEARRLLGPSSTAGNVALNGVLNADAKATWGKSFDDLIAKADATINGKAAGTPAAAPAGASGPSVIPIDSAIHATYTGATQQLALTQSYLHTPQTSLTMNGVVSKHSSLALRLQANDLREIATIANLFATPKPGSPAQPLDLSGAASFQGTVQGSTTAPHLTGQLSAQNLHVNGSDWKVFRTNVDASPSMASLQNGDLEPESRGRVTFNARAGLTKWAFTHTSPIQVQLDASQMDIAELTKLAGQQIPVTGTLTTHVTLHGTELNPIGSGNVALTKVTAYQEPLNAVNIDFDGTGDEAHANLSVQLPAGSLQGKVSVRPREKSYTAQLSSTGIRLDQVQNLKARKIDATGVVSVNANGQGTFDNPQLNATIQIPSLVVEKQTIESINLQMNMANHVANATLSSSAVHTSIQAKARVELTGDYAADATLDTQGIPLQPLLAVYSPEQAASITGETEVHATLHGPFKNKNLLEAHVTVPYLRASYNNNIQLAAAEPIHVDFKNNIVNIQRSAIRGTETNLEFQGSIPVAGNAPMSLLLQGTVNLQLAQLFDPDVRSSGQLKFNINSNGTAPNLGGEIDIVDANYASGDLPVGLQHGNGVLTLTSNRINISKFEGTVGGGTVTAQGGIAYRPNIQFDLGLAAKGIRILYPQGMRESVDANMRFSGTTDNANLGGSVDIGDLSFTQAFDLSSFISQFSGVAAPPSRGFAQNIALNLAVRSSNNVNLVSRTLSVNGSANLQVRGTAADPVILGRVILNNGDLIINGERFVLNGGTVQFVNPSETQPVVNLDLATNIQQYNIGLRFRGPVDQLQTQYSSDPSLPQADIINLLAFGQTTEASAVNSQTTSTNQAAESLVASQVSSQVTSRVSKIAGISQLSINPVLANGTSQGPPGANITIQQRVTGNLFVTFSSNVASTQSQVIQGQYQVSPRVAVSATRDPNGGFAIDTIIKKSW
ncbi:MAG TPA: translocation/assembly module TamB domain-containing protein [Terracidiphilus sp.]|jgi:translocation and assembly module TamB